MPSMMAGARYVGSLGCGFWGGKRRRKPVDMKEQREFDATVQ